MILALTCLLVLLATLCLGIHAKDRPLDSSEIRVLKRISDKLQREDSFPFN